MKVLELHLEFFKRFRDRTVSFSDPETGLAKDLIVLVGKNGSGKSSILQAIAAMLGTATDRLQHPSDLEWPGFDWSLINRAWQQPPVMEAKVSFTDDELKATREYFERSHLGSDPTKTMPGGSPIVKLRYDSWKQVVSASTAAEFFQFRGRTYGRQIVKQVDNGFGLFTRVGDVFWYTEQRTTNSLTPAVENGRHIQFDIALVRRRLSDLMQFHDRIRRGERPLRPGERDLFAELEKAYRSVFPTRRFDGPVPRTDVDEVLAEPWFYLYDGQRPYEIAEMSGGERAIFPLIFDFANWQIHNSVVLIDELELHLHPPLQQGLLTALRRLGDNNQFIVTTHSDAIAAITPESSLVRLEAD